MKLAKYFLILISHDLVTLAGLGVIVWLIATQGFQSKGVVSLALAILGFIWLTLHGMVVRYVEAKYQETYDDFRIDAISEGLSHIREGVEGAFFIFLLMIPIVILIAVYQYHFK